MNSPKIPSKSLTQDPHAIRDNREQNLEVALGRRLRELRIQKRITGAELAKSTGLSASMLSKIENGLISPSLKTLQTLAYVLHVPITSLFHHFEEVREAVHIKSGEGIEIERKATRAGHQYSLLGHITSNSSELIVEPYLITLTAPSDVFKPFQHAGIEFIFMLEGIVVYQHGGELFRLETGDSFFFDSDSPHGPVELVELPARYLSIISYRSPVS